MAGRLTDKKRKQVIADYVECGSYNAVAKKHKISATTVKRAVLSDSESVRKCEQKKAENELDMLAYLDSRKSKAQTFVDLCFDALLNKEKIDKAQLSQITTAMGTVIDKFAPKDGGNTKDEGVTIIDDL